MKSLFSISSGIILVLSIFFTHSCKKDKPSLPVIITTDVTNISQTTATSGGNVTTDGGASVTDKGVCWSRSTNPTVALITKTSDGTGTGVFTSSITGLTLGTIYYLKAYATNSIGTAYGNQVTFMALAIGDSYQGGKVAYIFIAGDPGYIVGETHGLIAAPSDQSAETGMPFPNADIICSNLESGGYTDWHLPSKDELNKLYINRAIIGGFRSTKTYWSSTLYKISWASYVWTQSFFDGRQSNLGEMGMLFQVRAVRVF